MGEESKDMPELEKQLSGIEDFEGEEKEFVLNFVLAVSDFVKKSEGKLIRALVNGDTGEITGDELLRYVKTLPVETYISIFRKMYADVKKYHPVELKLLEKEYEA